MPPARSSHELGRAILTPTYPSCHCGHQCRCCLLPFHVIAGSSPTQPRMSDGQGSGKPPDESFRRLETALTHPLPCPCAYCTQP
ncbi:hypothetical protein PAXRUDRAFT_734302 [Paxillus rubicundulus Ve08.2h10]|uniref:Uncharacterized protein n=1 Tax=Paxillus rubicundulus Ve08.2h10 TaxID=930991 RepID=A0A0D0CH38_9AGAM|nr:hypothetical protein PAXRUDRAFT_734302 [Paxillus rubicundulus Ve08.2h10]